MARQLRVLNLGAGVQSTTLLLLVCRGDLPRLDAAIFADTGWEPQAVYAHLDWLTAQAEAAGIPVLRVSAGNLRTDLLQTVRGKMNHLANPPFFVWDAGASAEHIRTLWGEEVRGERTGHRGRLLRKCTQAYKLAPIRQAVRALMREAGVRQVEQWMGISVDEAHRVKPSGVRYIRHRYPLIERGWSRQTCLDWLQAMGYPEPPKSACLGCPFHDDAYWVRLRDTSPAEWADTVAVDHAIRTALPGVRGQVYMHRSCVPLEAVAFAPKPAANVDQLRWDWTGECEGVCGI